MTRKKSGLTGKIIGGFFWNVWGKGAQAVLQFVVTTILARLLSPLEFGVIGAAMIVVGFSEIITKLGLGQALIQKSELEPRHLGTAFSVSLAMSFLIGASVWIFAAQIAGFFNYEGLETILSVLAFLFPIRGLGIVGESLAARELRFKWLANRDAFIVLIGYVFFGIGLAYYGFGVWSLVAASLVTAMLKTILLLIAYPPKNFMPERAAFRELIYFGGGQTIGRIFNNLALYGDNLVVGRMLGLPALGLYGRAYQLMSTQATLFGRVLDDVLFPSMAKMQGEQKRLANAYLRGVSLIALVMLPVSVVGFVLAPEIVSVVLGAQWMEVVLPFRVLALGLLLRTSYKVSDSLARATGAVYRRAWRQSIYAATVIGGAAIGQFWGVPGVAVGVLGALIVNFTLMAQLSLEIVGESWMNFFKAHTNAFFLTASTGLLTSAAVQFLRYENLPPLIILVAATVILLAFFGLILIFAPHRFIGAEGLWMLDALKKNLPKKVGFGNKKREAAEA